MSNKLITIPVHHCCSHESD